MQIFKNARILTETENGFALKATQMQVENGRIVKLGEALEGSEVVDCGGAMLVPGLFDVHTHGAAGYNHSKETPESLQAIADYEAKVGVTAFLATTETVPVDWLVDSATVIGNHIRTATKGAHCMGMHLEGPFFSLAKCGAQIPEWLIDPSLEVVERIDKASGGNLKLIAVAPELNGAMDFIRKASQKYVIAVGHTATDYETAMAAFAAGARQSTHTYNGMTGMTHRAPGVVGAVWDSNAIAELIGDGFHVNPAIIRTSFKIMGKRVCLISDSLSVTGVTSDTVTKDLSGRTVCVRDGLARLENGTIAGAGTPLSEGVRRVVSFGIPLEDAYYAASYVPAKQFGFENEIGGLREGKRADFALVGEDLRVQKVWVDGQPV